MVQFQRGEESEFREMSVPPPADAPELFDADEFRTAFGEALARILDIDTWEPGENLAALYDRLSREIQEAVTQENRIKDAVRREIFPRLKTRPGAPPNAGLVQAKPEEVEMVHRNVLFNGLVEACDGTSAVHDTLPVTIAQIGLCLVSYKGGQGSWVQRLFRRDLRVGGSDPVREALDVLDRRQSRAGYDNDSPRDRLSSLARRGIMAYAERAVLLHKSEAPWRMGHGNPAAYELLTGSGMVELLESSLELLNSLIAEHKKFVFVPSGPAERTLLTIGNSLNPLEYAIVDDMTGWMQRVAGGHYRGDWSGVLPRFRQFIYDVGSQVVVGCYRASSLAPPQLFYAHVEHAHEAALIAIADSALQEHRGFPMLIDLADTICSRIFGADTFTASTQLAYVDAGEPFRYLTERQTRR